MPSFDPAIQQSQDGLLTDGFRARVLAAKKKHRVGFWAVAEWAGFSGSFLGNVTRSDNNISTSAANRLAKVIEKLESAEAGSNLPAIFSEPGNSPSSSALVIQAASDIDTIEYALSTLRKHGLGVILVAGTSATVTGTTTGA
jgi:hypothetical protein